jgi:phage gpG-like protein
VTETGLRVDGAEELSASLARAARDLDDLSVPADKGAGRVAERARATAPRLTGELAGSIAVAGGGIVKATARHAPFVHWGVPSRNIPARPFLTLALQSEAERVVQEYETHVQDILDRVEGI